MATPNLHFFELPFEGVEPLGIIAINIGVLASGVSCLILQPGLRPFYCLPQVPPETVVKGPGWSIRGIPLLMYPPTVPIEVDGFEKPTLPPGVTLEDAVVTLLQNLRTSFDRAFQGVGLWDNIKDTARVVFTHPIIYGRVQLRLIRRCIERAGWLNGGRRELILVPEEEATVADLCHSDLTRGNGYRKHLVVINECGPAALTVACFENENDKTWGGKTMWIPEFCDGGFAMAYNHAKHQQSWRSSLQRTRASYRVRYDTWQVTESVNEALPARSRDILIPDKASELRAESVASLVDLLAEIGSSILTDAPILFCGKYISNIDVKNVVNKLLADRGVIAGPAFGPDAVYSDQNQLSAYYNYGAFVVYLLRSGLLTTLPKRSPQPNNYRETWGDVNGYWCSQYTLNGVPPDLSARETDLRDLVPAPPNDEIKTNLDKIRDSARVCYTQIRPWSAAETKIVLLTPVVDNMKRCFETYTQYLQDSLSASESGHSVSSECERLCTKLQNGVASEELQKIVPSLQTMAKSALEDATKVKGSFSSVRQTVIKAQSLMTQTVDDLRELRASFNAIQLLDRVNSPPPVNLSPRQALAIPIAKRVTTTPLSSEEANSDLLRVIQVLGLLEDHLGFVVDWWLEAESRLTLLGKRADKMSAGKIYKLEVRSSVTDWGIIKRAYLGYLQTVNGLLNEGAS